MATRPTHPYLEDLPFLPFLHCCHISLKHLSIESMSWLCPSVIWSTIATIQNTSWMMLSSHESIIKRQVHWLWCVRWALLPSLPPLSQLIHRFIIYLIYCLNHWLIEEAINGSADCRRNTGKQYIHWIDLNDKRVFVFIEMMANIRERFSELIGRQLSQLSNCNHNSKRNSFIESKQQIHSTNGSFINRYLNGWERHSKIYLFI